ncbi:hypothetical protein LOTGIDRAFT_170307 [Lottia gigantea]|uniref:Uncharacterized protein n=1 Tax=Lottia gigantea TaxID=225164 RepID=V3ZIL2_LOTGI|nr:hypothetical protein LOTGIDRAFT_170307 [Lottia gigantea]ESO82160.1 hypothetical protein LOTGIDRAFT_170307 [Lottia gigantea]
MGAYISHERIDVHLRIQNNIQPEHFEYSVHLRDVPKQTLIHHLELAADIDPHFNFSSSYHSRSGYFIDAINGLKSKWNPDKTYWEILNSDLKQTEIIIIYCTTDIFLNYTMAITFYIINKLDCYMLVAAFTALHWRFLRLHTVCYAPDIQLLYHAS